MDASAITYGSYTFPVPTPFVGQGVEPIYVGGKTDHFRDTIELVGHLTGENLSGLHLQKMQMISGLMSEFQTLIILNNEVEDKQFASAMPESISFDNSDFTTVLPYTVSFSAYSSGTFSEFFGIKNPKDNWEFNEADGRITNVSHAVSAEGVKVDSTSPLVNARHFVTGRATGCLDLSLFQTGGNAFLISRTEDIDKSKNSYSINETYQYSTTERQVTNSGIFTANTQISFEKEGGLNVNIDASVQGSMDGGKTGHLVHTGLFTTGQATEMALNAVVSSLSSYESGSYTFVGRGPATVSYNIDTGTNKIDFSYKFSDPENLDQVGNVLHTKTASITASKDKSTIGVSVGGEFKYNSPFEIMPTGDPSTGERFKELDAQFSGVSEDSGFFYLAVEALQDFREDATGYHISGNYLNPTPLSKNINKNPAQSLITYEVGFDNSIDISSGSLSGLRVSITDKKPLEVSGIVPSLGGFAKQKIKERSAGEYQVSASCENETGDMQTLIDVVSGHLTGIYTFSESSSVNDQTISYNTSRYY
tara:strand:- start:886 stop:2490 length:1605 start_codon:yes stop_codon:yes gene_type:complete